LNVLKALIEEHVPSQEMYPGGYMMSDIDAHAVLNSFKQIRGLYELLEKIARAGEFDLLDVTLSDDSYSEYCHWVVELSVKLSFQRYNLAMSSGAIHDLIKSRDSSEFVLQWTTSAEGNSTDCEIYSGREDWAQCLEFDGCVDNYEIINGLVLPTILTATYGPTSTSGPTAPTASTVEDAHSQLHDAIENVIQEQVPSRFLRYEDGPVLHDISASDAIDRTIRRIPGLYDLVLEIVKNGQFHLLDINFVDGSQDREEGVDGWQIYLCLSIDFRRYNLATSSGAIHDLVASGNPKIYNLEWEYSEYGCTCGCDEYEHKFQAREEWANYLKFSGWGGEELEVVSGLVIPKNWTDL
jgi:hypothetical protein